MAQNQSLIVSFIRQFSGDEAARNWIKDTRPLIDSLPVALRKMTLLAKLTGSAKTRVDSLGDAATVDDVFTCLETQFPDSPVQHNALVKCHQTLGQSVAEYTTAFQNLSCKMGNAASPELLKSLFVEGLAPNIRKQTKLLTDNKGLAETIAVAKNVEASEDIITPVYYLEQRLQQLESQTRKRTHEKITACTKCGRNNHSTDECKAHYR